MTSNNHATLSETIKTTLKVVKPVFRGKSKWGFRWRCKQIEAKIEDGEWLEKVQADPPQFLSDIDLKARLRIERKTKSSGDAIVGKESFFIEKIL